MAKTLDKQDWIDAAVRALAERGIEAVRIEQLARDLQVTKGSFYWHFRDRNALLRTLLEAWKARATDDIIALVEARGGNAQERLLTLGNTVFNADGRLDRQVRLWAANDPSAQLAKQEVDGLRLSYVTSLFAELGFTPAEASARAGFVYHAAIGQFAISATAKPKPEELEIIFRMLLRH